MRTREELFDRFIEIEAKTPDTMDSIYHLVAEERRAVWEEAANMCEQVWTSAQNAPPHYRQNALADGCLASRDALRARAGEEKP